MTNKNFDGDDNAESGEDKTQGADFGSNREGDSSSGGGDESANKSQNVDVEKLSKRLNDSQEFIDTLKSETSAYRQQIEELQTQLKSQPTIDEILEQVNQQNSGGATNTIDPEQLADKVGSLLESKQTAKQEQERRDSNFNTVASTLRNKFGKEVNDKVKELAAENGMSYDDYIRMAETSPKAALKLFGVEGDKTTPTPTTGNINTYGFQKNNPQDSGKRKNIVDLHTDGERVRYLEERFRELGHIN